MDWLLHNFIADMPGSSFLGVYAGVAVLVLAACYFAIRRSDPTKLMEPPEVPSKVDSYEIAYLRGGANEVIRVVAYALRQRGFIEVITQTKRFLFTTTTTKLGQRKDHPDEQLTDLEARIFDSVRQPKVVSDVFDTQRKLGNSEIPLKHDVKRLCAPYKARLLADSLLLPAPTIAEKRRVWFLGAAPLVALAAYKIVLDWNTVLSIIVLLLWVTFVATGIQGLIFFFADHKISARGKAYIAWLQLAYGSLGAGARAVVGTDRPLEHAAILAVGVSGLAVLKGTPDTAFAELFTMAGSARGRCGRSETCGGGC